MATPQHRIKDYIHSITRGVVNITDHQANDIVELTRRADKLTITKFKYNYRLNGFEQLESIRMDEDQALLIISRVPNAAVPGKWYKYDCCDHHGNLIKTVYTLNPHLFN